MSLTKGKEVSLQNSQKRIHDQEKRHFFSGALEKADSGFSEPKEPGGNREGQAQDRAGEREGEGQGELEQAAPTASCNP